MRLYGIAVLIAGGCGFNVGSSSSIDDARNDVAHIDPDAVEPDAPDAPAACALWHPQHFQPCMIGTPKPALTITQSGSPWTYNTSSQGGVLTDNAGVVLMSTVVVTQADNSLVAVLGVDSLAVQAGATLLVTGDKPLLIASWGTITINGRIDAGSVTTEINNTAGAHIDGPSRSGAGANAPGRCGGMIGSAGANAQSGGGSGGGGGGGFRGDGGNGTVGDTVMVAGGSGGARVAQPPMVIRGGCNGGPSGSAGASTGLLTPATAASVSVGGAGGGAIELAAKTSITISGSINAGGGGGAGAPQGSAVGGGGGGSGGYVGLDAPMIAITAGTISANGGGGGGSSPYAGNGNQGGNADTAGQAPGGVMFGGGNCGLAGSAGSVGSTFDAPDATGSDSCGGGGGGGGAGFIFLFTSGLSTANPSISPTPLP